MSQQTDKLNDYTQAQRDLMTKHYQHGREDAFEEAEAAARDRILVAGVICAAFGFAAGLGAAGVLS